MGWEGASNIDLFQHLKGVILLQSLTQTANKSPPPLTVALYRSYAAPTEHWRKSNGITPHHRHQHCRLHSCSPDHHVCSEHLLSFLLSSFHKHQAAQVLNEEPFLQRPRSSHWLLSRPPLSATDF